MDIKDFITLANSNNSSNKEEDKQTELKSTLTLLTTKFIPLVKKIHSSIDSACLEIIPSQRTIEERINKLLKTSISDNSADSIVNNYNVEIHALRNRIQDLENQLIDCSLLTSDLLEGFPLEKLINLALEVSQDSHRITPTALSQDPNSIKEISELKEKCLLMEDREKDLKIQLLRSNEKIKELLEAKSSAPMSSSTPSYIDSMDLVERKMLIDENERLRNRNSTLERESEKLSKRLEDLHSTSTRDETNQIKYQSIIQDLESKIDGLIKSNDDLRKELQSNQKILETYEQKLSDYKQAKEELDSFKKVEFGLVDDSVSLEASLLIKIRRMESELSNLRVDILELSQTNKTLTDDLAEKSQLLEKSSQLVKQLEEELFNSKSSKTLQNSGSNESLSNEPANNNILDVITNQRDRFHAKNTELENINKDLQLQLSELRSQTESMKDDTIQMVRKIKYLESFKSTTINVDKKYENTYEDKLDPFEAFRRQEQNRRIRNLGAVDRAVYNIIRTLLSNRFTRIFVVVYVILLHLLVFFTLLGFGMWEECRHDHDVNFVREWIKNNPSITSVENIDNKY